MKIEKLEDTSKTFRSLFLLLFTKELIKHSKVEEFFELRNVIKKEEPVKERRVMEFRERYPGLMPSMMYQDAGKAREPGKYLVIKPKPPLTIPPKNQQIVKELNQITKAPSMMQPLPKIKPVSSRIGSTMIPENPLPPPIRYVTPAPTFASVDLGKLNLYVNDPSVVSIETNGPDEPVSIKTSRGMQPTKTVLSKEDINEILQSFSQASRIPLHEGIFKIAVGKLVLSAVVSEVIGSRFIIRKMQQQTQQNPMMPGMMRRY